LYLGLIDCQGIANTGFSYAAATVALAILQRMTISRVMLSISPAPRYLPCRFSLAPGSEMSEPRVTEILSRR
jgi:hypothetical protein